MTPKKKKWRKILYEDQGVPDNYTDETFLDSMKKNACTRIYSIREVIYESGIVSQQISIITIFVAVFIYLDAKVIHSNLLIAFSITSTGFYIFTRLIVYSKNVCLEGFITVPALVFVASPILKTLTKTISTDTIYAMSTGMFVINLLAHDYGAGIAVVSKAISLNAGIFASVCLGSRLPSSWDVYAYVILAIQMFALFPELRLKIKAFHRKAYIILTETLVTIAVLLFVPINLSVAVVLTFAHIAVTLFFPLWMIHLQRLKNNIQGPWDEGMIKK